MPSIKYRYLIFLSIFVIIGFQVSLYFTMQRFQVLKPDFASLYQAGRKILHERFPTVIDYFPSLSSEAYSVQINSHEFPADRLHPPYEMVLYAPLALLKFRTAYLIWWACNLCFLFLSARVLWWQVPMLHNGYPYLLILISTFFPVLVALVQGQNSILLLAVLSLAYHSFFQGQDFRAGLLLSMGMFKFVLIIPIAFWMLLGKRWKSIAGFVVGCVCLLLASVWLVGKSGLEAYCRTLVGFGRKAPEEPGTESIMPNLRGMFHSVGSGVAPGVLLTALTLVCSIALIIWVDSRLTRYSKFDMQFSAQVLLATLVSYHFYPHDGAVLILPIMVLLNRALKDDADRIFKISVLVCAMGAYLAPFIGGLRVGMPVVGAASLALLVQARNGGITTHPEVSVQQEASR